MNTKLNDETIRAITSRFGVALKNKDPQAVENILFTYFRFGKLKQSLREHQDFIAYKRQLADSRSTHGSGWPYLNQEKQDLTDYLEPYISRVKIPLIPGIESRKPKFKHGFVRCANHCPGNDLIIAAYGILTETFVFEPKPVDHHFFFITKVPPEQETGLVKILIEQAKYSPGNPAAILNHWFRQNNVGTSAMSANYNPSYGLNGIIGFIGYLGGDSNAVKMVSLSR
ncbi:MAG: hypothetical protein V1866_01950 [archaeon]